MSEQLDAAVEQVLHDMACVPGEVRGEAMERLFRISAAVDADMMESGTTIIEFVDLADDAVVLSMTISPGRTHLDVSTAAEAIRVSNGYDFVDDRNGLQVIVDHGTHVGTLDHGALAAAHRATDAALAALGAARAMIAAHPAFQASWRPDLPPEGSSS